MRTSKTISKQSNVEIVCVILLVIEPMNSIFRLANVKKQLIWIDSDAIYAMRKFSIRLMCSTNIYIRSTNVLLRKIKSAVNYVVEHSPNWNIYANIFVSYMKMQRHSIAKHATKNSIEKPISWSMNSSIRESIWQHARLVVIPIEQCQHWNYTNGHILANGIYRFIPINSIKIVLILKLIFFASFYYYRPYKCDICNEKSYAYNTDLKRHKRSVHGIFNGSTYPCAHCSKVYYERKLLKNHINKSHKNS